MVSVSAAVSAAVVARPPGRMTTEALAATTAPPAAPSATDTFSRNVNVPDTPPGEVETFTASACAPTNV